MQPFRRQLLVIACLLGAATSCVPVTSAYLSVPVVPEDGREHAGIEVCVPFNKLERLMRGLDPDSLAFYAGGREPVPHQLIDEDGDGAADAALVVLDVAADGSTRLTALSPGPTAVGELQDGEFADHVVLRFDRARR